jgi:type IV pilus assembly protein PilB
MSMGRRIITKRIGEILMERGVINAKQLEQALLLQKEQGGLLGQILVKIGAVTEQEVALALTAQYGFPYLPLDSYEIDVAVVKSIPEHVSRQYCLIPIDKIGNAMTVAMADPSNMQAIEDIEMLTSCVVQAFVSTPSDIQKTLDRYYGNQPSSTNQSKDLKQNRPETDKGI